MGKARELIATSISGLLAKKGLTLFIMLGPAIGVAAIVGIVGLSESAKGDLKRSLNELGTNLIVANASSTFSTGTPKFDPEVVARAKRVKTIEGVSATASLTELAVTPSREGEKHFQTLPVSVKAADENLPEVLDVEMRSGRWLNDYDEKYVSYSVVLGAEIANEYNVLPNEARSIIIDDEKFAVVGILDPVSLAPSLDSTVFIPFSTAVIEWADTGEPSSLYLRAQPGTTDITAEALPIALSLGGGEGVDVSVPSSLLEAESQVDDTLRIVVLAMGGLMLVVGALLIGVVMFISVLQRSSEIGIRRALGHTRGTIAGQFLLEAVTVGILGCVVGMGLGIGFVFAAANSRDWVVTLNPSLLIVAATLAVGSSIIAGLIPAMKAANLEPLATLRLG